MSNGLKDPTPPHRWIFFMLVFGLIGITTLFIASRFFQHTDTLFGHSAYTSDPAPMSINLDSNKLAIPRNMIRSEEQRIPSPQTSLDLFYHWPSLKGYNQDQRLAFTDISEKSQLIFIRLSSPDKHISSSERLYSVYSQHFTGAPVKGPNNLIGFKMSDSSSYAGETIFFKPDENPPYVVRCFQPQEQAPAICLREILLKNDLQASYRFRRSMLDHWREIDTATEQLLSSFQR